MLLDRESERQELDRLLGAAREGLSGALVLRGEAGIGKTALLEYALEVAGEMQIASVAGVESEMELGFAACHQLLLPFLGGLDRLPTPQREALGSAFGLIPGRSPDLFLVGLAVLTLLAEAAAERPIVCVFDDAQWIDKASSDVLGFVARRILADPIAMLFAIREPSERSLLEGLSELRVGGLPDHQARELLASVAVGPLDRRVGDRLVSETRGNPLALVEFGSELTRDEFSGGSPLPEPLRLGTRLEERFLNRIRTLPQTTQTLLLIASAQQVDDPAQLWRAAARLGIGAEAAEPSALANLLVLTPRVAFRHPLIRSAVYQGATQSERRQAHEALAAASDPERDPDRHAWHRALAAVGPDEEIAAELERSAERARSRGGLTGEAAFLERAAELTGDERARAARRLRAAQAELAAGAQTVAAGLLEQATPLLAGPVERAEAKRLQARVRFAMGEVAPVPGVLLEAAQTLKPIDTAAARETLLEAFAASLYAGQDAGEASTSTIARVARETPRPPQARESPIDMVLDGIALLDVDYAGGARALASTIRAFVRGNAPQEMNLQLADLINTTAEKLYEDDAKDALTAGQLTLARDRGDLTALLPALAHQVHTEVLSGRLAVAETALAEGREIASATGNIGVFGSKDVIGLPILAWRGDEAHTRAAVAQTRRGSVERGAGGMQGYIREQNTILELALGNYRAALDSARPLFNEDHFRAGTTILPDLIEAASRCDERATAAAALERLSERALANGTELALGLLARSSALLTDGEDAERLHTEAIEHLQRCRWAPQLARAHLLYGEWLRRQRRRRHARDQLRTAHEMFDSMGVEGFAERARVELLATGEHARKRVPQTRDELTPQEAQVARLASEGASNQEIATQLFISSSTVAYHLRKVFRKLDISGRAQLLHALSARAPSRQ